MMHEHIPKEFYDGVDRVARQVTVKWPSLEWEDTRQNIWVELLSSRNLLEMALKSENPDPLFRMLASRTISSAFQGNELAQGNYLYGTKEVRSLLDRGNIQDHGSFTLTQTTHIANGMLDLRKSNPSYFDTIVDRFVHGKKTESTVTTRSVDKLCDLINRKTNKDGSTAHQGIGARVPVSNGVAQWITTQERDLGQSWIGRGDRPEWVK
jgi:hypothetical protein